MGFYVLLQGVFRVIQTKPKEVILTMLKAGAVFEKIACFDKWAQMSSPINDESLSL